MTVSAAYKAGRLHREMRRYERYIISTVLTEKAWNVSATARYLGISRVGLCKKLRVLGLTRPPYCPMCGQGAP